MAKLLKLRRGTTTQHASFTGAEGEVTIDITKDTAVVHDGSQAGGRPMAREDMSNVSSASIAGQLGTDSIATTKIAAGALPTDVTVASANIVDGTIVSADIADGTIVNADISGSAAIDASKISGLTLDKIYEGNSKVEVVDTGTGQVSTEIDGTLISRAFAGGNTNFKSGVFGSAQDLTDGSGQTISIMYGGGTSNTGLIACTHTTGLQIQNSAAISLKQNGFPNQYYASFSSSSCNFFVGGNTKLQVNASGVTTSLNILPSADSTHDIGTNTNRFANIYGDTLYGDGANITNLNIVNDTTPQLGGHLDANGKTINCGDSSGSSDDRVTFGAGTDLSIFHNGTNSHIHSATGELDIRSDDLHLKNAANNQDMIHCTGGGSVALYNNNVVRLETLGTGVSVTGALVASGDVTAFSDATLKTEINTINDALGTVGKLRGVSYKWLKDGKPSIGVIAQEVEEVIPEVVHTTEYEGKDVKSVDYGKLVGVLIEAVKELKTQLDEHKAGGK